MTTKQNDSPFAAEFWQTVADTAYMMDHESRANQARWLCGLDQALTEMLAKHPEIHGSLDDFAMHAVQSLVHALARVDENYQQAFKEAFKRATGAVDPAKAADRPENDKDEAH